MRFLLALVLVLSSAQAFAKMNYSDARHAFVDLRGGYSNPKVDGEIRAAHGRILAACRDRLERDIRLDVILELYSTGKVIEAYTNQNTLFGSCYAHRMQEAKFSPPGRTYYYYRVTEAVAKR